MNYLILFKYKINRSPVFRFLNSGWAVESVIVSIGDAKNASCPYLNSFIYGKCIERVHAKSLIKAKYDIDIFISDIKRIG